MISSIIRGASYASYAFQSHSFNAIRRSRDSDRRILGFRCVLDPRKKRPQ